MCTEVLDVRDPGMVAHSCDFSSLEVEENGQKFEASFEYTVTSSPAEDT